MIIERASCVSILLRRLLPTAAWTVTVQVGLTTRLVAQETDSVILRWRLLPSEVVIVRTGSSLRATQAAGKGDVDTLETTLVLRSSCAESMVCHTVDLSRRSDAYAVAMGAAPAARNRQVIIGKGSALVSIDSLWRSSQVGRDSVGTSDTGEMLDDLEDAVPVLLPAGPVRAGDNWNIGRTRSRALHGVRFTTTYSGTTTLDSVTMRGGGPTTAWLTVSGRRGRTQGTEERFLSDEQFHGTIAWDIVAGHPMTATITWDGRAASRAGMLRITTRSSTSVTARKGIEPIF